EGPIMTSYVNLRGVFSFSLQHGCGTAIHRLMAATTRLPISRCVTRSSSIFGRDRDLIDLVFRRSGSCARSGNVPIIEAGRSCVCLRHAPAQRPPDPTDDDRPGGDDHNEADEEAAPEVRPIAYSDDQLAGKRLVVAQDV